MPAPVRFFITVLVCSLLMACGSKPLPLIAEHGTILAFGDSLTDGKGTSRDNSYPAVLEELSGRTVINAGISGEITADGLVRLQQLLDESTPDLLILLQGGNDILRNMNLNQTRDNLSAMITLAQNRNIPVLLIGVPEKSLFSSTAPLYRELAEQHNVPLMDDLIARLLKQADMKSDSVHFNEKGYRSMAEQIHKTLKKLGAL